VAVAGFDDSIFSRVSPVSITTVRQDVHAMAALSAKWILRLARGEAEQENATQLIPCEVVVRESTG
jgi:DNA-binding LacI/PurR family transcriptional regulator